MDSINADEAYARGITGKGQIIGFVDTGLDDSHAEFADKTIRLNDRSGLQDADVGQLRHGTGVASIELGGRGTGSGMHGVAFDADPAMWSLRLTNGYLSVNDAILSRGISALQGAGGRIINHSWGCSTALNPALHGAQTEFLETSYGDTLALMRQRQAIHVWAAGNEGHDEIAVSSAWPVLFPDLAGFSIAVAALGDDGKIGRDSNRCGAARAHCLAAPGGVAAGGASFTRMATPGGGYRLGYGTSYAAPYVSGVLALMMQAFGDQLSLPEYTARLLATADKSDIYANQALYGQGLVDADSALRPYGDGYIPLPTGGLAGAAGSIIRDGDLPRDMRERLRREKIIILDELNTPFSRSLIADHDPYQSFEMTEWMTQGDNRTGPETHPFLHGFAAAQEGKVAAYWTFVPMVLRKKRVNDENPDRQGIGFSARLTRRRSRLSFGMVGEENGLMGAAGSGALSLGPSHSALLSYATEMPLGDMTLSFDGHWAVAAMQGQSDGLVRGTDSAVTSTYSLSLQGEAVSLQLSQPSYFEHGVLNLKLPYRRRADGTVLFTHREFSLSAPQRPLEVKLFYQADDWRLGMRLEKHAGLPKTFSLGVMKRF